MPRHRFQFGAALGFFLLLIVQRHNGLEGKPQRELHNAGILRARYFSKTRRSSRIDTIRNVEIGMVEQVECFPAKLQLRGFAKGEIFLKRQIECLQSGANNSIARHVSEGKGEWVGN